ncbi:GPCR kinase [Tanacetum coccineum]
MNVNRGIMSVCLGDVKNYLKNEKLDQVVAIIKSCASHALGNLTITLKDLSSTIYGTIHHKVINDGVYGKDNTIGVALILANVSVFSPKSLMHYVNIITRNLAKVFCKDIVPGNGSGVSGNVTNQQEHQHRLDQESLILALEEEAREARLNKSDRANVGKNKMGAASYVVHNDILVRRCDPDSRGLSQRSICVIRSRHQVSFYSKRKSMSAIRWDMSRFIAAELSSYLLVGMLFSKITRSKDEKNGALMSRVPKVDVSRRHVRGDKLISYSN